MSVCLLSVVDAGVIRPTSHTKFQAFAPHTTHTKSIHRSGSLSLLNPTNNTREMKILGRLKVSGLCVVEPKATNRWRAVRILDAFFAIFFSSPRGRRRFRPAAPSDQAPLPRVIETKQIISARGTLPEDISINPPRCCDPPDERSVVVSSYCP